MTLEPGIAEALCDVVGAEHVWLGAGLSIRDASGVLRSIEAAAVVFPATKGEIVELVRGALACDIPLTATPGPRIDATPWCNPGGIMLALNRMHSIRIDAERRIARLQPAATMNRLADDAASVGLRIDSPSPESRQASARTCVTSRPFRCTGRWGCPLSYEVVLPAGTIVGASQLPLGRSGRFSGVITEVTVGLSLMSPHRRPHTGPEDSRHGPQLDDGSPAGKAASQVTDSDVPVSGA